MRLDDVTEFRDFLWFSLGFFPLISSRFFLLFRAKSMKLLRDDDVEEYDDDELAQVSLLLYCDIP